MKYAVISDIHGNVYALKAVLADAGKQGAEKFLFLGDYAVSYPWGNEVADIIRGMKNAVVIRGNGESYLIDLTKAMKNNDGGTDTEQFKPVYWAYRSLSNENLEYLTSLPETALVNDGSANIYLVHAMDIFFKYPGIKVFHPHDFNERMIKSPFTPGEYSDYTKNALLSCPETLEDIKALSDGAYVSGHNHIPFHMEYEGKLLLNPGSCGDSIDWDNRAAYAILESKSGRWAADIRRVEYDTKAVAEGMDSSGFTAYSPVWGAVMGRGVSEGRDYLGSFVTHLVETGRALGRTEYPVANDVFCAAVKTWAPEKIYK